MTHTLATVQSLLARAGMGDSATGGGDGTPHGDGSGGSDGSVKDSDGNNGVCATKDTGGTVSRHKTCEYRSAWPDSCGNWQAT